MRVRPVVYTRCVVASLALLLTTGLPSPSAAPPPQAAGAAAKPSDQPSEKAPEKPQAPITLEFDLPDDFQARGKDNSYVVTGFRVGLFKPKGSAPVKTIDFKRDQVVADGRTARITIERNRLPENLDGRVLRVQTMAGTITSEWSDPSPWVTGVAKTAGAKAKPRETRETKHVTMADVERHPRLLEAVRKAVPSDLKAEDLVARFRTTEDLALGVVIAEQEKIPFDKLSAVMMGPPARNLRAALREIRPSLDSKPAVRKARQHSKTLLNVAKSK